MSAANRTLIPSFPYRDLDGTPFPNCEHQHMTTDPVELAIEQGIGDAILAAGLPVPFVRAGDPIRTTWGCERNKKLKVRDAIVTSVSVGLYRSRRSMWFRPALEYLGKSDGQIHGMLLRQIERQDGAIWEHPEGGQFAPFMFRLEWVSKNHGGIERGYPFCDATQAAEGKVK